MAGRLGLLLGTAKHTTAGIGGTASNTESIKRPSDAAGNRKRAKRVRTRKHQEDVQDPDDLEQQPELHNGAYGKLIDLFASGSNGAAAHALKQRRQEAEGDSEGGSEDDESSEEDHDGYMSDELESELEGSDEQAEDGEAAADDDGAEQDADGDGDKHTSAGDASEEEADHDVATSDDEADPEAGAAALGASQQSEPVASAEDYWQRHLTRDLTDAQVAELQSGKCAWQDDDAAAAHQALAGSKGKKGKKGSRKEQQEVEELWEGSRWQVSGCSGLPPAPAQLQEYGVKERLVAKWRQVQQQEQEQDEERRASGGAASSSGPSGDFASRQQQQLFSLFNSYRDVWLPARPYLTDYEAPDTTADAYLLHVINHVLKASDAIKKNNAELRAKAAATAAASGALRKPRRRGAGGPDDEPVSAGVALSEVPRDQGFTRPKALLLLPIRSSAHKVVSRLVQLALGTDKGAVVHNRDRLEEQFTDPDGDEGLPERQRRARAAKPAEHKATFAGNTDDHFRLGIRLTRGSVKLFSDLYQSDIIVASPIALATKIAEDAKKGEGAGDFLSSVEVLVVDRADVLLMQNWAHVETVLEHLNNIPKQQHGTDIMRVREWYLGGTARCYRQTIMLSSFAAPDMNAAVQRFCCSHAGKLRLKQVQEGVLAMVVPQVRQLFERHPSSSPAECSTARLDFFKKALWPRIKQSAPRGLLLLVPHYFDYVRLRNFLLEEDAEYAELCEYTDQKEVARGRSLFARGELRLMVLTERAHFYNRFKIRGIHELLLYSLPQHAHYYCELVNLMEADPSGGHHGSVTAMFSRYEALQLERIVGSSRAKKMLKGDSGTFMFC